MQESNISQHGIVRLHEKAWSSKRKVTRFSESPKTSTPYSALHTIVGYSMLVAQLNYNEYLLEVVVMILDLLPLV